MYDLSKYKQFDWDNGNILKNYIKHKVSFFECEEVFLDNEAKMLKDIFHSAKEDRFIIIGKTYKSRLLYIVFTFREDKIRVISARDINKNEIKLYEKEINNSKI